jgi:tetratricopeptide (TPR) repeat protein
MQMAPKPFPAAKRLSVADARIAFFAGDYERCLEICSHRQVSTLASSSEVALFTARALLRCGRPDEAEATLAGTRELHLTLDASLTAQLLTATARIAQGDPDTAIGILADAVNQSAAAHASVRSEIALCTALGYWAKREIDVAQAFLAQVDAGTDIIHARALELQAWCHIALREYRRAAESFRLTLLRLDECQVTDHAMTATAVSSLAIFAAELFDRELAAFVEARAERVRWSADIETHHYITLVHQALFWEFAGNTVAAYQYARQATEHAPTLPLEASAWSLSSSIARNAGEYYSAIVFAQRARDLLETVDARELAGEERFAMLSVAESCAPFDPDKAAELFAGYWGLAPVESLHDVTGDPRLAADETFISGVVAQARGEAERARICYRRAFDSFKELGYVRRAATSAHALLRLGHDAAVEQYLREQMAGTFNYLVEPPRKRPGVESAPARHSAPLSCERSASPASS